MDEGIEIPTERHTAQRWRLRVPTKGIIADMLLIHPRSSNRILVLKGSDFSCTAKKSCPSLCKQIRNALVDHKKVSQSVEGEAWIFREDVLFSSPSSAANVIQGHMESGPRSWEKDGMSLKEAVESSAVLFYYIQPKTAFNTITL